MTRTNRPHLLGIDDGPFDKRRDDDVPIVGVLMEGHDLVEAVATTRFAVDGGESAAFLAAWIAGLRFATGIHGIVFGGITIAGLGIVEVERLSAALKLPVMVVNRHAPSDEPLIRALESAGLGDRAPLVERTPPAWKLDDGLHVSCAGTTREEATRLLRAARGKSQLPEPLRLAHLIAGAIVNGQSRGRP